MAERGVQENNGSPMGYGQPKKRRGMDRRVVMNDQAEQIQQYGDTPQQEPQPQYETAAGMWNKMAQQYGDRKPTSSLQIQQGEPTQQGNTSGLNPGISQPKYGGWGQGPQRTNKGGPTTSLPAWATDPNNATAKPVPSGYQYPQQPTYANAGQPDATVSYGGLNKSFQDSVAQGYTDIKGTEGWKGGQYMNQLEGFNTGDWGTDARGSNTLKNSFGKIASNYDVTQPGALQAVLNDPRMKEMMPNATIVQHQNMDQLDPDGPGPMQPVDVIRAATEGGAGQGWAWQPQDQVGQDIVQQDWWNGQDMGMGPMAPANQLYNQAFQGTSPQQMNGQAMEFLQWLLQQQQSGQLFGGTGESPVTF